MKESHSDEDAEAPSDECEALYRKIAMLIHPDRATDDAKRELGTRLMKDLNADYAKRDMKRIERILAEWEESPDAVSGEGTGVELIRVIRAIALQQTTSFLGLVDLLKERLVDIYLEIEIN